MRSLLRSGHFHSQKEPSSAKSWRGFFFCLDRAFTLERVNCLGCCAIGPVVVLDGIYYDHMTPGKLRKLVTAAYKQDKEKDDA